MMRRGRSSLFGSTTGGRSTADIRGARKGLPASHLVCCCLSLTCDEKRQCRYRLLSPRPHPQGSRYPCPPATWAWPRRTMTFPSGHQRRRSAKFGLAYRRNWHRGKYLAGRAPGRRDARCLRFLCESSMAEAIPTPAEAGVVRTRIAKREWRRGLVALTLRTVPRIQDYPALIQQTRHDGKAHLWAVRERITPRDGPCDRRQVAPRKMTATVGGCSCPCAQGSA